MKIYKLNKTGSEITITYIYSTIYRNGGFYYKENLSLYSLISLYFPGFTSMASGRHIIKNASIRIGAKHEKI